MIRNLENTDIEQLREIYRRSGLNFGFPDLSRKMAVEKVFLDGERTVMSAVLRPTTEAYIFVDPTWQTPWVRWNCLQILHAAVLEEAREKKIEDTQAVLDPPIERAFGRRLLQLGWSRHGGTLYSRRAWEVGEAEHG